MFGSDGEHKAGMSQMQGGGRPGQDGVHMGVAAPTTDNMAVTPTTEKIPIMGYIPVDEYVDKTTSK